jgi:hypothetical protein
MERERRESERKRTAIPTSLAAKARAYAGVTRNISRTGALIGTQGRPLIGDQASLELNLEDEVVKRVAGRVVRIELAPKAQDDVWPYLVAVRFLEPLDDGFFIEAGELGY